MNVTHRQIAQACRRLANPHRAACAGSRDEPVRLPEVLRRGLARIVSNDGDGQYTVTERWWDPSQAAWRDATEPLGIVGQTAFDWKRNATGGARDDLVPFWEQRAVGGEVLRLIDLARLGTAPMRVEAFCAHYSGTDDWEFASFPGCAYALGAVGADVRECSGHADVGAHPAYTTADLAGLATQGYSLGNWINTCGGGGDWLPLAFSGFDSAGNPNWQPEEFDLEWKVDAGGDLRLRVRRVADPAPVAHVSCVIMGFVQLIYYPQPPGDAEGGNCCCHEDPESSWGDGEWSN